MGLSRASAYHLARQHDETPTMWPMDRSLTTGWCRSTRTTPLYWPKAIGSTRSRSVKMARHIGGNPLRPICCDACVDIVRMSCVFSRIRRYPSPSTSQNRRCECPRSNRRSPAVSEPSIGPAPSARTDPIWKSYASRASTCYTHWSNPFRGKPRSPPWDNLPLVNSYLRFTQKAMLSL
jgi:hypothetical protein